MSNCPHCYAEPANKYQWLCLTTHFDDIIKRTDTCRIQELEQRNAKLEAVADAVRRKVAGDKWNSASQTAPWLRDLKETLDALDKEPGDG